MGRLDNDSTSTHFELGSEPREKRSEFRANFVAPPEEALGATQSTQEDPSVSKTHDHVFPGVGRLSTTKASVHTADFAFSDEYAKVAAGNVAHATKKPGADDVAASHYFHLDTTGSPVTMSTSATDFVRPEQMMFERQLNNRGVGLSSPPKPAGRVGRLVATGAEATQ